jgi:chromate transporter
MRDDPLLALIVILVPLSLAAIGGASSIYAPLQHEVVDIRQWITAREFIDLFAIARVTPGPGSMLATLIGWKVAGVPGALVATLALYVPACLLCVSVMGTWNRYRGTRWHSALESGLAPIGAGLIFAGALALIRIGEMGPLAWGIMAGVAAWLTWRPRLHPLIPLLAGAALFMTVRALTGIS